MAGENIHKSFSNFYEIVCAKWKKWQIAVLRKEQRYKHNIGFCKRKTKHLYILKRLTSDTWKDGLFSEYRELN